LIGYLVIVLLDKLKMALSEIWSAYEDGNEATIAKAFIGAIFIEIEPPFFLVIEEVDIEFGKLPLHHFLVFASSKGGRAVDSKAIFFYFQGVNYRVKVSYFIYCPDFEFTRDAYIYCI
jgi:hypothetical protein